MKIISTIVDSNYILYGLELAGRSSEFKEEGKDIIRKVMTLNKLIDNRFKNSQIACLKKALKVLDGEQSEIIKKLWMYKISCFSAGNYEEFKITNKEEWAPVINNKSNDLTNEFICKEVGCENLILKLKGLDIF